MSDSKDIKIYIEAIIKDRLMTILEIRQLDEKTSNEILECNKIISEKCMGYSTHNKFLIKED